MRRRSARSPRASGAPSKRTSPASGAARPRRSVRSVVLPAPLGPTTASVPPRRTARSIGPSTVRPRCRFTAPRTSRSGGAASGRGTALTARRRAPAWVSPARGLPLQADLDLVAPVLRLLGRRVVGLHGRPLRAHPDGDDVALRDPLRRELLLHPLR